MPIHLFNCDYQVRFADNIVTLVDTLSQVSRELHGNLSGDTRPLQAADRSAPKIMEQVVRFNHLDHGLPLLRSPLVGGCLTPVILLVDNRQRIRLRPLVVLRDGFQAIPLQSRVVGSASSGFNIFLNRTADGVTGKNRWRYAVQ
jgi:hypothetical protein